MKANRIIHLVAAIGGFAAISAHAQTGAPSAQETKASGTNTAVVEADSAPVSSYATYLMVVDGVRRADAADRAANFDRPAQLAAAEQSRAGSYATYLAVIDGMPRDAASRAASNIDGGAANTAWAQPTRVALQTSSK